MAGCIPRKKIGDDGRRGCGDKSSRSHGMLGLKLNTPSTERCVSTSISSCSQSQTNLTVKWEFYGGVDGSNISFTVVKCRYATCK